MLRLKIEGRAAISRYLTSTATFRRTQAAYVLRMRFFAAVLDTWLTYQTVKTESAPLTLLTPGAAFINFSSLYFVKQAYSCDLHDLEDAFR